MIKGFTLIELMVAITIISILFGVIISSNGALQKSSRDTQRQANLKTVQGALEQYKADHPGGYPPVNISTLVNQGYVSLKVATDPTSGAYFPYQVTSSTGGACGASYPADPCVKYCLYSTLENGGDLTAQCADATKGNYSVNQP